MTGLDHDIDQDFEDELRAMLRRRAADIHPNPPEWRDLLDRSNGVVVSLRTGRPVDDAILRPARGRETGWSWGWVRPVLAAAACLAVVMAAGIVIGRSGGSDGSTGETDPSDDEVASADAAAEQEAIPAAGSGDFRPASATAVFPRVAEADLRAQLEQSNGGLPVELSYLSDPDAVARAYLESVDLNDPDSPYELRTGPTSEGSRLEEGFNGRSVETITWWWSLREPDGTPNAPVVAQGPVYLRNLAEPDRGGAWVVVGASTQGVNLSDVRRSGDALHFDVSVFDDLWADIGITHLSVQVLVNDEMVNDEPLPYGEPTEFTASVPADQAATVRLQQIGSEHPLSVTETVFPPASERTPNPDHVAPTTTRPSTVPVQEDTGVASFDPDCAPDDGLSVSLDLPSGFPAEARPVDGVTGDPATWSCVFSFAHADDPNAQITVGRGTPPFRAPDLTEGPACFPWASTDDGGFVAVRTEPLPIYVVAEGLTSSEFDQAIDSSQVLGSETWAADEGC
jgi:hypothetical protein